MTCPKCNEETIIPIIFKATGKKAHICENCEVVWFEGEEINEQTGRLLGECGEQGYTYAFERLVPEVKQIEETPLENTVLTGGE